MHKCIFDGMIANIKRFAEEVFSGKDEDFKSRLLDELELITKMGTKTKRSPTDDLNPNTNKKLKIDPNRKVELPNEIWIQIMTNLPSKDVYGSLALLNKRFNGLCLESGVTKSIRIWHNLELDLKNYLTVLGDSRAPIEIINEEYDENAIVEAILLTKKLKTLKLSNNWFDTYDTYEDGVHTVYRGKELSMNFIEVLKQSNSQLEHLELKGIYVRPEVMIEISKIESLKTFKISDARRVVLTPEVINALADNDNQLEAVEFDDIIEEYYDPTYGYFSLEEEFIKETNIALNNFMLKKFNTLKSLKNISKEEEYHNEIIPLANLSICHRLEEFCGYLIDQNIEILSCLPKLKKLQLLNLKNPKYLLDNMHLANLKYLSLDCGLFHANNLDNEIQLHYFPVLQRLCISSKLTEQNLKILISNAPRLKSIQFPTFETSNISNKFLYEILKDKNILVIFGRITTEKQVQNEIQSSFEMFLMEQDLQSIGKYSKMKLEFSEWCKNNPNYGY